MSGDERMRGLAAATAGFLWWGLVPIYWKQIQGVSAFELVAHRIVWSLFFLVGILSWRRTLPEIVHALRNIRTLAHSALCGGLLAINWTVYVWAVNAGNVIEASLGYFMTPLGNVAFGYLLLQERLRVFQWASVAFAAAGVLVLLTRAGHVPWVAVTLAVTWSLYGMLKKQSSLNALTGLTVETAVLFPMAAAVLLWRAQTGDGALGHVSVWLHIVILSSGVITAIPLVLFAYGAQRLRMVTIGLVQYVSPTVQFLLGLFLYQEPFDSVRFQACVLIWIGLVLYTADSFWAQRGMLIRKGN